MRHDSPATQDVGFSMRYEGTYQKAGETKWVEVTIRRGKNANMSVTYDGNDGLAVLLADPDEPFSIFTPGLSGIPVREEWRTKGAMDAAVMHGDANLYLRTALLHKSSDDRGYPFPGRTYPTASVTGMPSAVKPFRTATRTWNSAT